MPTFTPDFQSIKSVCDACGKVRKLERHHIGREFLFVKACGEGKLKDTAWYEGLCRRYHEFRQHDIRALCNPCHQEIHFEYNQVLRDHNWDTGYKDIRDYTIPEAKNLIKKFRQAYFDWRDEFKRKGEYKWVNADILRQETEDGPE